MNFFDRFKKPAKTPKVESVKALNSTAVDPINDSLIKDQKKPKPAVKKPAKTPKDLATEKGEPYVAVLSVELDTDNIGNGAFELDWNDKFIINLVRAGYQVKANEPESDIVDRWFRTVCQNVVLETYEQEVADPDKRVAAARRDLDDGRTEFS